MSWGAGGARCGAPGGDVRPGGCSEGAGPCCVLVPVPVW